MAQEDKISLAVTQNVFEQFDMLIKKANEAEASFKTLLSTINNGGKPSSLSDYKNQINQENELANSIKRTSTEVTNLTREKEKLRRLTAEEKLNNSIINKQQREEAILSSKLTDAYQKLNVQRTRAKENLRALVVEQGRHTSEVKKAQREFDVLDKKVRQADKAVGDMSKNVGNYKTAFSGLGNLMGAFGIGTGLYLAADIARNIFNTTKELQSLDLALKNVSGSQEAFSSNQLFLSRIAQDYGIEIKGLTKNYTDFLAASKGLLSQEKIEQIFTSVSKSASAMGLSIEATDSAFLALEQMMSKGTIQAEELKKQLGNALPGAMRAAAMAYMELHPEITKVADAERIVMKEMKAGAIDSATYIPLIVKQFEKLYGIENITKIETLQGSVNKLSNSWTDLVRSMNESKTNGIGRFFSFLIDRASQTLDFINRISSGWDVLQKKASSSGVSSAKKDFLSDMQNDKELGLAGLNDSERRERLKQIYLSMYKDVAKEYNQLAKKTRDLAKKTGLKGEDYDYFITKGIDPNKKLELKERLSYYNELIKLTNTVEKNKPDVVEETEEQKNKRLKTEQKAEKDRLKAIEDENKKIEEARRLKFQREISDLERSKEIIKDYRDAKETSLEDILFLEDAYSFKELEILKKQYEEEQRLAGDSEDLQQIATNKFLTERENLIAEHLKRIEDIRNKDAKKTADYYEKNPPLFMTVMMNPEKELSQEEKDSIRAKIQAFNEYVGEFAKNSGFEETFNLGIKQQKNGKTLLENLFSKDGKLEDSEIALASITLAQDVFNFVDGLSQQRFDNERNRLEEQYNLASKHANGNAEAQKKLDEDYEKRKKKLAEKEWKHKQRMTMVNIVMDTAQAIMAVLGETGQPWMIPVISALGAIQLGIVATQKMPAYKDGTLNHKGGLALVNDGGGSNYAETIVTPDGKISQPKGRNLVVDMPQGSKVYNHEQWQRHLNNMSIDQVNLATANGGITYDEMDRLLEKHVASQTNYLTSMDSAGFNQAIIKNGNITRRTASRANGVGLKFN